MYKLSLAATAVSAGFFGAKDPFDQPFFNKGGFGTPKKPTEGSPFNNPFFNHGFGTKEKSVEKSPFNIGFFNRPPEKKLFNKERPFLGGIFNHDKKHVVGNAPNRWIPFLGKRDNNRVLYNEADDSLNVSGPMVADAHQSMTFDSRGLNGMGASTNNFESVQAGPGSTVTFALLLI